MGFFPVLMDHFSVCFSIYDKGFSSKKYDFPVIISWVNPMPGYYTQLYLIRMLVYFIRYIIISELYSKALYKYVLWLYIICVLFVCLLFTLYLISLPCSGAKIRIMQ